MYTDEEDKLLNKIVWYLEQLKLTTKEEKFSKRGNYEFKKCKRNSRREIKHSI